MPDLFRSLHQADFGYLKIIAEKWGLELQAPDVKQAREQLVRELLQSGVIEEDLHALPLQAREALEWLHGQGGRAKWANFTRGYGQVREMGAGRRERFRPEQQPISPAEELWYRGLIGRGFFDTDSGPQEFAYLPEDLHRKIRRVLETGPSPHSAEKDPVLARKATAAEREKIHLASDWILDHTCTLLSGARMGIDPAPHLASLSPDEVYFYRVLLAEAGILEGDQPRPEAVRQFLELSRRAAFLHLWKTWRYSLTLNDLDLVPTLEVEGEPEVEARRVREVIFSWIQELEEDTWWSLSSLTAGIKHLDPDFLRRSGDYDSWFIRDAASGEFIRGFEHWDHVEGALIHYLIAGPGHWLGIFDLASPDAAGREVASAFRLTPWADRLLRDQEPTLQGEGEKQVQVRSKGKIKISRYVDRRVRYQVGRFTEWLFRREEDYFYRISPDALVRAQEQQLDVPHLLALLTNHVETLPPNLVKALERWAEFGSQAEIGTRIVLRVQSPAVLDALQKTRAQRYLQEKLGPTTIVLKSGSEDKVREVMVEMGFLVSEDR